MTADQMFAIANPAAIVCWLLLAAMPGRRWVTTLSGRIAPGLFALAYLAIVVVAFAGTEGSFSTLAGVGTLFDNPWMLMAGWLHYLAFDLLTGTWEAIDSVKRGVPRWLLAPCLFLTLMFGPVGWLAYLGVRTRYPPRAVAAG